MSADEEILPHEEEAPPPDEPPEREQAMNSFYVEADEVVALIACFSEEHGAHESAAERRDRP